MRRATEMVLDDEYYDQKERIRVDMQNSLDALEALTRNAESEALTKLRNVLHFVRAVIVLQVAGTLFFIWLTIRLGINPVLRAVERIRSDRPIHETGANEFRYHAQHDSLTKALNPNAFYELSREMIVKNPKLPWIMVTSNIMDFRLVNTLFGAQRGNEMIVRNAALLQRIALASNGLCGRIGGDQFALLIPKGMYQEPLLTKAAQELMADALGMDVVAEGVETETQLKSLIDMGCRRFQGYYFSRPLTVEEFETREAPTKSARAD